MTTISLDDLRFTGERLNRPECVVAHRSGLLFAPDWTGVGGVSVIFPDGRTERILATKPDANVPNPLRTNGLAVEAGGSFLISHLGDERGGVYRLYPDGRAECITDTVEGAPMPPANFACSDSKGRIWITVSTRIIPRAGDYRTYASTGYIALHEAGETRIVADGLGYTNECLLSADETRLWVNETFAQRLTVFDVTEDGLSNRRVLAQFGPGTFPDGMAEAEDGSIFVTSIVSNRLLRVFPDGRVETWLEDVDPAHLARIIAAFEAEEMGRPHLDKAHSKRLKNISNIAFGGPDRKTAYLGCLLGESIAYFDSPLAGRELPHWSCDIGPLLEELN